MDHSPSQMAPLWTQSCLAVWFPSRTCTVGPVGASASSGLTGWRRRNNKLGVAQFVDIWNRSSSRAPTTSFPGCLRTRPCHRRRARSCPEGALAAPRGLRPARGRACPEVPVCSPRRTTGAPSRTLSGHVRRLRVVLNERQARTWAPSPLSSRLAGAAATRGRGRCAGGWRRASVQPARPGEW